MHWTVAKSEFLAVYEIDTLYLPSNGGKSTKFGAGDLISAAIGPRRIVGVHCCCFTPIVGSVVGWLVRFTLSPLL